MSRRVRSRLAGLTCLAVILLLLPFSANASSPSSSEPLSSVPGTTAAIPLDEAVTSGGLVMQAHAETLRPAPLPDPDVEAPALNGGTLASQANPHVTPDLFSSNAHAIGDGYAPGSSIETDHNNRHSAGGGMSLSIPMQ